MQVEPFEIAVADEVIDDLKDRLRRTRWPEAETVDDWSQGIPLAYVREVCDYWARRLRLAGAGAGAQPVRPVRGPTSTTWTCTSSTPARRNPAPSRW